MKIKVGFISTLMVLAGAAGAAGHGTPIHVEVVDSKLVVSQGLADSDGFASMIYVEDDDEGDPLGELTIPVFGPVIVWQIPGFDVTGMDDASNLSLEVIRRPVADSPTEERTLWYWNDQSELVEPAPAGSALHLLARANLSRSLTPNDLAAPPPLLLSDPMTGQQGFHNHGLLSFALDNDPPPPSGAYGFFARLTSNQYAVSDPFLVVLNNFVDYEQMIPAARAINAAAIDAESIAGDYDANGIVNTNDYTFWRARFGNSVAPLTSPDGSGNGAVDAADYVIWRNAMTNGGGAIQIAMIPEPEIAVLLSMAALAIASIRWRRSCP